MTSGIAVRVNAQGLDKVLKDVARLPVEFREIAEDAMAEAFHDFRRDMQGPGVKAPGLGEWAVDTGRSVKGWRPTIEARRGTTFTFSVVNTVDYSPYVRKSGQPIGTGVRLAQRSFTNRSLAAGEEVADEIEALLKGDR